MTEFTEMHQTLLARYNLEELRTLCATLEVDFDDLGGEGRSGKARELILLMKRRGRLQELRNAIERDTPPNPLAEQNARRKLAILERQAAGYTPLTIPPHLLIELEDARNEVARPERQLNRPPLRPRSPAPTPVPPRSSQRPPTGPIENRWALLVGINRYVDPAFPDLKFCVNDVLALRDTLTGLGYTVVLLYDGAAEERLRPTRDNFEAELTRICRVAGPDDLLWVHFAGHGKLLGGRPVLITREMRRDILHRRALFLDKVKQTMTESKARRLILTLDACHTGLEIGRDLADPEFIRNAYDLAEGFALIAASTAQQIAQEWEDKQHGVFTYYLLEGLAGRADRDGKGFITVSDLVTHTLDGLRRWNVIHGGLLQEPTYSIEGLGDIILADRRKTRNESGKKQIATQL